MKSLFSLKGNKKALKDDNTFKTCDTETGVSTQKKIIKSESALDIMAREKKQMEKEALQNKKKGNNKLKSGVTLFMNTRDNEMLFINNNAIDRPEEYYV